MNMTLNFRSLSGNITKVQAAPLVRQMIGMPLQNRECSIELLQQNHSRQFMRDRHPAQRKPQRRGLPRRFSLNPFAGPMANSNGAGLRS